MVQGVKVERATVRTTLTPWAATARLCLGRRWSGWEPTTLATLRPALANGAPSIPESERPRRRHVLKPRLVLDSGAVVRCGPRGPAWAPKAQRAGHKGPARALRGHLMR